MVLPMNSPYRVGLLAGISLTKSSKSPEFYGGVGGHGYK